MQPQHIFYNFELVSSLLLPSGVTLSFVSSSVEDDSDTKKLSKEEKGKSAGWHPPGAMVLVGSSHHTPISTSPACEPVSKPFSTLATCFLTLRVLGCRAELSLQFDLDTWLCQSPFSSSIQTFPPICELLGHSDTCRWRKCFEFSDTGVWWVPGMQIYQHQSPLLICWLRSSCAGCSRRILNRCSKKARNWGEDVSQTPQWQLLSYVPKSPHWDGWYHLVADGYPSHRPSGPRPVFKGHCHQFCPPCGQLQISCQDSRPASSPNLLCTAGL